VAFNLGDTTKHLNTTDIAAKLQVLLLSRNLLLLRVLNKLIKY